MLGFFRAQRDDDGRHFHDILPVSDPSSWQGMERLWQKELIKILALSSDNLSLYRGLSEIWLKEHALSPV
jgi:hypothetical protein